VLFDIDSLSQIEQQSVDGLCIFRLKFLSSISETSHMLEHSVFQFLRIPFSICRKFLTLLLLVIDIFPLKFAYSVIYTLVFCQSDDASCLIFLCLQKYDCCVVLTYLY